MNQILITKKLYITPELKKKKKIYKFDFLLSIFLMIILISVYIYAEYDRNKSEEVSQDLLAEMKSENNLKNDDTTVKDNNVLVVVLDDASQTYVAEEEKTNQEVSSSTYQSSKKSTQDGYIYSSIATINIPKINVNYAILEGDTGSIEETEALLKISPCKFWGPNVNEVGNFCIVGHNYRNSRFFSKVPTLTNGDTFEITDLTGRTIVYEIYDKYIVDPHNLSCTSQLTGGKKEVTLITCTDNSEQRVIIKAKEVK